VTGLNEFEKGELKVLDYNRGIYVDANEDNIGIYASSHHKHEDLGFGLKHRDAYDQGKGGGLSKYSRAYDHL